MTNYKFTGQELDEESGLYYYNARYYDPSLGRFLTADTLIPDPSNAQSYNRYSYVHNNPIRYTDPTGHRLCEDDCSRDDRYQDSKGNSHGDKEKSDKARERREKRRAEELKRLEEFKTLVATVCGEACTESEAAQKAVAHVIMNRIGVREWRKLTTALDVIKKSGFDAYTYKNAAYRAIMKYLQDNPEKRNQKYDDLRTALRPIYEGTEEDSTSNAILYYSPLRQVQHNLDGKASRPIPRWNFNLLEYVPVPGLQDTDDFLFWKYP